MSSEFQPHSSHGSGSLTSSEQMQQQQPQQSSHQFNSNLEPLEQLMIPPVIRSTNKLMVSPKPQKPTPIQTLSPKNVPGPVTDL